MPLKMLSIVWGLLLFMQSSLAGSPCPPRENIYPCSCLNVKTLGKTQETIVQCHRLRNKVSLDFVFRSLKSMKLDHFHLYDSYWEIEESSANEGKDPKAFPHDWIASLKSKSVEIVDSPLAACFACDFKLPCRNIEIMRFVMMNSTSSSNFCTLCDTGRNNSYPWINCMTNLQELAIIRGRIETLLADFFPITLKGLQKLNLSHNEIRIINRRAFEELDTLLSMDLSHNRIVSLENVFLKEMKLVNLDVSWNKIQKLDEKFFRNLPNLKFFLVRSNHIVHLIEEHWKNIPRTLKIVDLEDNPLKCHCNMKWVNITFQKQTSLKGSCLTEKMYATKNLKLIIRYVLQRCETMNKTSTSKPTKKYYSKPLTDATAVNIQPATKGIENNFIYID